MLGGAGVSLALAAWIRTGEGGSARGRLGPAGPAVLAVLAAAALAAATSINPWLSLVGSYSRYESLPVRAAYLGLFVSACWLLRTARDRERVVGWFIAGCGLAALEAVWQGASRSLARPDGNLGQPNLLGALLAMAAVLALARTRRDPRWAPLLVLIAAGLYVSSSRSGWLGAAAGITTWLAMSTRDGRRAGAALGGGLAATVLLLALLVSGPLRNLNQDTGTARLGVWRDTARLVAARPLTGWGEDAFGLVYGHYQSADWEPGHSFDRAHDQPLDLLAAQGVLGFGTCAWLWGMLALSLWRRRPAEGGELPGLAGALAAYLAWSLFNFDWAPATGPAWLLAGTAWSALRAGAGEDAEAGRGRLRAGRAVLAGGVAVAAWLGAAAPLVADLRYYEGRPAAAVSVYPWQARYHRALAGALTGRPRLAELRRAADLGSTDPSVWVELGDAEEVAGDHAAALRAWRRARDIYPYDPAVRERP